VAKQSCFSWGGELWGQDYPGWTAFRAWLINHGADPVVWALNHPAAAQCIGAPVTPAHQPTAPSAPPPVMEVIPPVVNVPPPPEPAAPSQPIAPAAEPVPAAPAPVAPVAQLDLGPFAGIGVFTSNLPTIVLSQGAAVQWVAVRPGISDPRDAVTLRNAGIRVIVWEQNPEQGQAAVDAYGAVGYIAAAEGPDMVAAALVLAGGLTVPKAFVTNLFMDVWPDGWVCIPEAFESVNPQATVATVVAAAKARGATAIAPVMGAYSGESTGGTSVPAAHYIAELQALGITSYSIYSGEAATADWWPILAAKSPASPSTTSVANVTLQPAGAIPPPPVASSSCFTWGGQKWGKTYPGVNEFVKYLRAHGTDVLTWGYHHPTAADCIGLANYVLVNESAFPLSPEQRTALIEGGFTGTTVSQPQVEPTPQPVTPPSSPTTTPTPTTSPTPTQPAIPAPLPAASWEAQTLSKGGWPETAINEYALSLWADSEGVSVFANNPLAATDKLAGSTPYPPSPIVQVYVSLDQATTLYKNKFTSSTYKAIGAALAKGDDLEAIYQAINQSPWCAGCQGGHYPVSLYNAVYGSVAPPKSAPPVQPPVVTPVTGTATAAKSWGTLLGVFSTERPSIAATVSKVASGLLARVK
jgi:hypothetical protein